MDYMRRFDSKKHKDYFVGLPFSYFSLPVYMDGFGHAFERNGEIIGVTQDIYNPHDFPSVFLPQKKENWENCSITFTTQKDINRIKEEGIEILAQNSSLSEFVYSTNDIVNLKKKSFRNRVRQFERLYEYKIFNQYNREKIVNFYKSWKRQRSRIGDTFAESEKLFFFMLDNLEQYSIKQIYIEVDSSLVGLAWGVKHQVEGRWVGLQLKVDYQYKGISRFLHHQRACLFSDFDKFSIGGGCRDEGITQFKEELGPVGRVDYYYILTGKKKSN